MASLAHHFGCFGGAQLTPSVRLQCLLNTPCRTCIRSKSLVPRQVAGSLNPQHLTDGIPWAPFLLFWRCPRDALSEVQCSLNTPCARTICQREILPFCGRRCWSGSSSRLLETPCPAAFSRGKVAKRPAATVFSSHYLSGHNSSKTNCLQSAATFVYSISCYC